MNAPDWKKAPTWAQYAAMDSTGAWYFYEIEPALSKSLGMFSAGSARVEPAVMEGWERSLCTRNAKPRESPGIRLIGPYAEKYTLKQMIDAGWSHQALVGQGHAEWTK